MIPYGHSRMARLVFMGSPEIAVPALEALVKAGHSIALVVTQPDKPKGRGQSMASPPVKQAAEALDLQCFQAQRVKTPEFAVRLREAKPDFMVVVAYGRLLTQEVLNIAPCINVHFSLLPRYRGASCVASALLHGDTETGVSTILLTPELDAGPLLLQWSENIQIDDTTETLSRRLAILGAQQIVATLEALEAGRLKPVPQNDALATDAPLIQKEDGHVNWAQDAQSIFNRYRAFTPWPGLYAFLNGKRVVLTGLALHSTSGAEELPGTLIFSSDSRLWVQCASGILEITHLKPEGKKNLTAEEFMRGCRERQGLRFV